MQRADVGVQVGIGSTAAIVEGDDILERRQAPVVVGTSVLSLPTGAYSFTPASSGRVSLDFAHVITIGEIECYTVTGNRRVLLQLASVSRLRIQGFGTGACGDPATWLLDAGAVEFDR